MYEIYVHGKLTFDLILTWEKVQTLRRDALSKPNVSHIILEESALCGLVIRTGGDYLLN